MIFSKIFRRFLPVLAYFLLATGCDAPQGTSAQKTIEPERIRRFGQVIRVRPEKLEQYKELHANPWPCVLEKIRACNIRNYSIFLQDDHLFAYFEYVGNDFEKDMERMAADTCTQRWWRETDPCQEPIAGAKEGDWWTTMEEVFHAD
jgi:L-rhamnose mutarotase